MKNAIIIDDIPVIVDPAFDEGMSMSADSWSRQYAKRTVVPFNFAGLEYYF